MKYTTFLLALMVIGCQGQSNRNIRSEKSDNQSVKQTSSSAVGGYCEVCDLMYVDMPKNLHHTDTSAGWNHPQAQKLLVTGKVYQIDGIIPAPDVVVYYWHTDTKGYYSNGKGEAKRHGELRGWVKTDSQGYYNIYTSRPAAYPDDSFEPQHIHLAIKEPDIEQAYYIDEFVFDDDPLLFKKQKEGKRRKPENRGGNGRLRVLVSNDVQIAEHNIILGLHIPNYPRKEKKAVFSGLAIGEEAPSFSPVHAWGADKGSTACPVCKYGRYHGILFFVGERPDWQGIKKWLVFLEAESLRRKKELKVYFVYGNSQNYDAQTRAKELEIIGSELGLKQIALTFVPSWTDEKSEANLYQINPEVENTFIIYHHRTIIQKYINFKATDENFKELSHFLDKTKSPYNHLSVAGH